MNDVWIDTYFVLKMFNISDAVVASTLKELVTDELVMRITFDEIPPHVEYCLTKKVDLSYQFYKASAIGPACFIKKRLVAQWYIVKNVIISKFGTIN